MIQQKDEQKLELNIPKKARNYLNNEEDNKINKAEENKIKDDDPANNDNEKGQVYKSCFMEIHLDAVYHELDVKSQPKQTQFPNLKNFVLHIHSNSYIQINFSYLKGIYCHFKQLNKLKIILYKDGNMNSNSCRELGSIYSASTWLKELTMCIEQNNIQNIKSMNGLFDGVKKLTQLAKLKIIVKQQSKIKTKQYIECIGDSLKQLLKLVDLTLYLTFSTNDQNNYQEMSKLLSNLSHIQNLIIVISCDKKNLQASPYGVISIFKSLNSFKNLKELSFSIKDISVNPSILEEAFSFLPTLKSFTFYTKYSISKNQIWEIQTQQCLRKIFPCFYNYNPLRIKQEYCNIFKNIARVENLSFAIHDLAEEGLISLGQELCNFINLKNLSILINPENQENIIKILPGSSTDLYEFHEDYIKNSNKECDQGMTCFAQGLRFLNGLKTLKLQIDHFKIKEQGADALKQCFQCLKNMNHLALKIRNNYCSKGSIFQILMEGIQNMSTLKTLELDVESFIFSTDYTQGLANCFKSLSQLTTLNLSFTKSYNVIADDNQVSCVAEIFQNLQNLQSIKLVLSYPNSAQIISNQLLQHIKKVVSLHLEIYDSEISRQNLQQLIQSLIECSQIQYFFFKLQSNKDDNSIFDKYLNKILIKKQKFLKRLVKFSYKN